MSWQDVSVVQLRHAINDVDDPQRYSDSRLQLAWIVGASYVVNEFTLANTYTVDVVGTDISPDPAAGSAGQYADPWALNLITLRSAIMMISNDLKLAANSAFRVQDVHMRVDLTELYKANKEILAEAKESYENLRMQYQLGVNPSVAAVLTPINILSAGYRMPMMNYSDRDRLVY